MNIQAVKSLAVFLFATTVLSACGPFGENSKVDPNYMPGFFMKEMFANWTPGFNNIVAYWKLNDQAGSTKILDSSGNGNHGTVVGEMTLGAQGQVYQGGNFHGTTGVVQIPWPISPSFTSAIESGAVTYCAWVFPESLPTEQGIVGVGAGGANGLNLSTAGSAVVFWYSGGAVITTASGLTQYNWYHLCGVANSLSDIRIYVNGALSKVGGSGLGSFSLTAVSNQMIIGNEGNTNAGRFFDGTIDEVTLWNRALSDSEILTLYNRQK